MFSIALTESADLRPLEPWQAPEFFALIERERSHFGAWLPWAVSIDDLEKAKAFLQRGADRQAAGGGRMYSVWLDGEMVGGLLFRVFDAETGNCEMGVWLAQKASGRGLVTIAANHLIDWAFHERGMHRIEWHAASGNEASLRVAKRLGMTHDGVLRQAFHYNGARHDEEIWSLLVTDTRPSRKFASVILQ